MSRILFEREQPIEEPDPDRADVAFFAGLIRLKDGAAAPQNVMDWLKAHGWLRDPFLERVTTLTDIPIPIENYASFAGMFDEGASAASLGTDYVAAAVRSFFAQGGRRCYVVRTGDPLQPASATSNKAASLKGLLPDGAFLPDDRRSWHGVGHLGGLPDVTLLAVPDLPAIHASEPIGAKGQIPVIPSGPEQFVECSAADVTPAQQRAFENPAPRLAPAQYGEWSQSVKTIINYLAGGAEKQVPHLREIQFVAAFPLPLDLDVAAANENASSASLAQDIRDQVATLMPEQTEAESPGTLSSAFLQLSYPWLKTSGSSVLLQSLEPPDGALAGMLARNALTRGAHASAVKVTPAEIYDVWPELPADETTVPEAPIPWGNPRKRPLIQRLSLFGFTPSGLQLLSDVTCYPGESYRPGRVNRLVSVIARAARRLGEEVTFERNGETLWARVQTTLQQLLTRLWRLDALEGASPKDAFTVQCDRSTMTQNDIDNGRLIAVVTFTAAATIELIHVTLAINTAQSGVLAPRAQLAAVV